MDILKYFQADVMLVLSAVCGIIALFVYMTDSMPKQRRLILILLELSAMLLLVADRRAYIYRGDQSTLGWWMVRISNFMVFFLMLVVIYAFNLYLVDLYTHEGGLKTAPAELKIAKVLALVGIAMVIISQFTGLYYTFDEQNRYQRAPGFILCYIIPMVILLMQAAVILKNYSAVSRGIRLSLLVFIILSISASILQVFVYGVSLNNMAVVTAAAMLYIFALKDLSRELERGRKLEVERYKEEQKREHMLFEQTAEALAAAIDAKDEYTHGHSARVAMYSTQIAREAGKTEEECEQIYFAALLHDVGKIGVDDAIINKEGRLTDEEFAQIKLHPVYGNQILSSIQLSPYLSIGAHFHHERYDGRGYPEGRKGEDIPEIARIISVADAYDAMTSKRSYRDTIPQQKVREELVKGMGTQFDPKYAKIMLHLIDLDLEYRMKEQQVPDDEPSTRLECERIYHECSLGILISEKITRIRFYSRPDDGFDPGKSLPAVVIFDALDGRIHEDAAGQKDLLYYEYGQIFFSGRTICGGARKIETKVTKKSESIPSENGDRMKHFTQYVVEAVRFGDHVMVRVDSGKEITETIIALPDKSRFAYISLTGEHCLIRNIHIDQEESSIEEGYIPRIAEEVSFIKGRPEGDIPNVEVDGWRSSTTEGVPIRDGMAITFHGQSLPTARLVWHCPYVSIYTSADGKTGGDGYREFLLLRLDGENWESDEHADNEVRINQTKEFVGWNEWKERNRKGIDIRVDIHRDGRQVVMETENLGMAIESVTTIKDEVDEIYVALTGDQCALTDIHLMNYGK